MVERAEAEVIANNAVAESWSTGEQVAGTTTVEPQQTVETPAQQPDAAEGFVVEKVDSYNAAAVKLEFTAKKKGEPIVLPPDTQIEAILVSGDDLIIREADGDLILIKGGLKNIPVIVIGTVEIPAEALTASLEAGGVTLPAAGDEATAGQKSSGANLAVAPGFLGDAFDIRALLKPTAFDRAFTERPKYEGFIVKKNDAEPQSDPDIPPVAGNSVSLALDDQNLPDGTTPAGDDSAFASITFTAGTNPISSIVFSTDVSGLGGGLDWVRVSDIQIVGSDGGVPVVTLDLSVIGTVATVTATLNDNYDSHPGLDVDDLQDLGSVGVVATDTVGLTATGTVNVSVSDDLPTLTVDAEAGALRSLATELDETVGTDRANAALLPLAETADGNTDDIAAALGQTTTAVSGGLASLFAIGGIFGADGPGTTTGTLSFVGVPGGGLATNLSATVGGAITLFATSATLLEGKDTAGDTVFSIAIVDTGGGVFQMQTTLYKALHHGDDGAASADIFDETVQLLLSSGGPVQLQYDVTRTDSEGDSVSQAAQIDLITTQDSPFDFDDDGPTAPTPTANSAQTVVHDETPGIDAGDDDVAGSTQIGALPADTIAALFSGIVGGDDPHVADNPIGYARSGAGVSVVTLAGGSFGSDGPQGSTGTSYALVLGAGAGTPSGVSTTGGTAIFLYQQVDGTIVGRVGTEGTPDVANAGGDIAFAVSINAATGEVYTVQYLSLLHTDTASHDEVTGGVLATDAVQVTATYTDGDGDSVASAAVGIGGLIQFADDGPSMVAQATVAATVEEDDLNNAQSVGNNEDSSVNKHIASGAAGSLNTLVNFGADGSGGFNLVSQAAAITWIAGLGLLSQGDAVNSATVVGDTVTAKASDGRDIFTLTIADNGSWTFTLIDQLDHHPVASADNIEGFLSSAIDLSGLVVAVDGDGDTVALAAGSFAIDVQDDIPISFNPADSEVDNAVSESVTAALNTAGKVGADEPFSISFTGGADGDAATNSDGDPLTSGGDPVYLFGFGTGTLVGTTDPTNTDAAQIVFQATLNADNTYTFTMLGTIDDGSGFVITDFGDGATGGNDDFFIINREGPADILVTPTDQVNDTVNTNANGIGIDTGLDINAGEGIRFELVTLSDDVTTDANDVTGLYTSTVFGFGLGGFNSGVAEFSIEAFNASQDAFPTATAATMVNIIEVRITLADATVLTFTGDGTQSGRSVDFLPDGSVLVDGVDEADGIEITSATGINRIEITNTSVSDDPNGSDPDNGASFYITDIGVGATVSGDPVELNFDVELTDYDGDATLADFNVTVTPPPPPPSVTVDIVDASLNDGNTSSLVTFEFSENVTGFDLADLTPVGGTLGSFTTIDGNSYTATFTATDGFSGTGSVSVGTGYTSTGTGITGTAGSDTVPVDRANPTATVNIAAVSLNDATNSSLVTIQFSEGVANFVIGDLAAVGGALSGFTTIDADTYQVTFTATDGFQGTGSVTLTGAYDDTAGNAGVTGASDTVALDRTNPTAAGETIRVNDDTFVIPESILLLNDSNGAIDVTNVSNPGGSNVATVHTAGGAGTGSIAVEDLGGPASGGSFTYQAINAAGNTSANATVTIVYDVTGAIDGTAGADIIIGGAGNDSLNGLAGADILYGGDGNDTLDLGNLDGARDTVIFDATALGDSDTINQMLFGNLATSDVIDLTDLFTVDSAGGQTLSDYARVTGTSLEVDVDGGVDSFVAIATLTGFVDGVNSVSVLYDDNQTSTDQSGTIA